MKRILVPTDFSDNALKATLYAAEIARKSGAVLYLLHAPELGHEKIHQPFRLHEKYNQLVLDERMTELRNLAKNLQVAYSEIQTVIHLQDGSVLDAIGTFCNNQAIDLIIMGTKGASGIKEVMIGSVTASVIENSKVPVLAIPEEYSIEEPDTILLATNHFEQDVALLNTVAEIAEIFNTTIHVVVFMDIDKCTVADRLNNPRHLHRYMEFLHTTFPEIIFTGELLEGTSFEGTIERYEIKNGVDIIAMVRYSKGFWPRLLQKSATRKMAFHSTIPILAIPASASEPATANPGKAFLMFNPLL